MDYNIKSWLHFKYAFLYEQKEKKRKDVSAADHITNQFLLPKGLPRRQKSPTKQTTTNPKQIWWQAEETAYSLVLFKLFFGMP